MKLFGPEHERVLFSLYGDGAPEFEILLRSLSAVLEAKVLPLSLALDQGKGDIAEPRRILFEQGLCKLSHPGGYGGMGLPFGVYALAMELAGAADASTAMSLGIHNTVADAVAQFGSGEQKRRLLPSLLSGERLAAFALTEPSSGSDARSMRTKATKDGRHYVLDGSKMYITNAGEADLYLVFASIGDGHDAFLVEASNPGLKVGAEMREKLGMRGSHTAEVRFEKCRVAADESLLGSEGAGFEYAKKLLDSSRIVMGMLCIGIARTAFGKARAYAKSRELFGKNLSDFQLTREKIANAAIEMSASRLLCLHAARLKERGLPFTSEAAQGKILATEMAARTCDAAIQLLGGYGYTSDDVHRHWRDARLLAIGEGASEVLRLIIASEELGRQS
jgi:alkylation response protein AidB-like acyl-CoA dehydrogenase